MIARTLIGLVAAVGPLVAEAREQRSSLVVAAFKRESPCPATKKKAGPCPGWQVDHVQPLCAGGKDTVDNLQWLTVQEHKIKTRSDSKACRLRVPPPLSD